jgi:hypothetical protein
LNINGGYISNFRYVIGSSLYTSNFTPSKIPPATTPETLVLLFTDPYDVFKNLGDQTIRISNAVESTLSNDQRILRVKSSNMSPIHDPIIGWSGIFRWKRQSNLTISTGPTTAFGTGDFTIEFWVKFITNPPQSATAIVSIGAANVGKEIRIGQNINGQGFGYRIPNNQNNGPRYINAGSAPLNQWHYVVLVRQGTNMYFYLNGIRVNTTTDVTFNLSDGGITKVGSGILSGGGSFNGYLYDLRVVKGTALYTEQTHPIPTAPLTVIDNTSLLLTFSKDQFFDNSTNNHLVTLGNFTVNDQFGNNYTTPSDARPTPHTPFDYQ